jgi:hypothetical protein
MSVLAPAPSSPRSPSPTAAPLVLVHGRVTMTESSKSVGKWDVSFVTRSGFTATVDSVSDCEKFWMALLELEQEIDIFELEDDQDCFIEIWFDFKNCVKQIPGFVK